MLDRTGPLLSILARSGSNADGRLATRHGYMTSSNAQHFRVLSIADDVTCECLVAIRDMPISGRPDRPPAPLVFHHAVI